MLKMIIHADDFGISAEVNECINQCFLSGELSETSLMVNMPDADNAVKMARNAGYINCVGLHLNLTKGRPLTQDILGCSAFCNNDGEFNRKFHLSDIKRLVVNARERRALELEIKAQIEKFCAYENLMMKIDSHHHAHTDWPVFSILRNLAPRYGFQSMRISANVGKCSLAKRMYKYVLNKSIRRCFRTTQWFGGYKSVFMKSSQNVDGDFEVMVHPVYSHDKTILDTNEPYGDVIASLKSIKNAKILVWRNQ